MSSVRLAAALLASSTLLGASFAQQQCLQPTPGFHAEGVRFGLTGGITGIAGLDDGSGPELFVSGVNLTSAGAQSTVGLARWDGAQWSDTGVPVRVDDIAVYDDGGGPRLYALVNGTTISTWNGTSVVPMADQPNDFMQGLDVVDLGSGPELYTWGAFTQIGSVRAPGIARWNGSTWSAVTNPDGVIEGPFAAFDEGMGTKLFGIAIAGNCDPFVARLDGSAWSLVGDLEDSPACERARELLVHDDGSGPALYLAGRFSHVDGVFVRNVARWNGATWSALGSGIFADLNGVRELATFDDGSGPALYAVGIYDGAVLGIQRWNGSAWQAVGAGLGESVFGDETGATAIGTFDDGSGARLVAAGNFEASGSAALFGVARWDGATWAGFGNQGQGTGTIACLEYLNDGSGDALYAGGAFFAAGQVAANHIARWNGSAWTALGTGTNGAVNDIVVFDGGGGPDLYIGGSFTTAGGASASRVARWDGSQWFAVGAGLSSTVNDLLVHNGRLYAATESGAHLSVWDGVNWQSVAGGTNGRVVSLASYNGFVYATGEFTLAGSVTVTGVARYDPIAATWAHAGVNINGGGLDLTVHDDGTGPALYVVASPGPRRLQGNVWSTFPDPLGGRWFASVDLGLGRPSLVAVGVFDGFPIGVPLRVWNGVSWTDMSSDIVNNIATSIAVLPGSSSCAPEIFVGGWFTKWGASTSHGVAKLTLCGEPAIAYCFGDGSLSTPCPCTPPNTVPNPSGAPGHGCANSFDLDGAKLCAVGTVNPDTVTLRVSGQTPAGFTQFFKGSAEIPGGFAIFDGVRCVGGTFIRFGAQNAVLGTAFYPNPGLGFATPLSAIGGTPVGSGQTGHYQTIYRNVTANFCSAGLLNFSNALSIAWQ